MENKLKVGILGLSNQGQKYLEAVYENENLQLSAIAGSDLDLSQRFGQKYDCAVFDDYRQLIIQSDLDLLIDATTSPISFELLSTTLKSGINFLRINHSSPGFDDASSLVKIAKKNNARCWAANQLTFSPGFTALREYIKKQEINASSFFLISAFRAMPVDTALPENRWLTDPALAGGGILLQGCFEMIQEIISCFDIPQQVYALTTNLAPDKKQLLSVTEDVVALTMKFTDRLIGTIQASRVWGPEKEILRLYRQKECITVTRDKLVVTDDKDNITTEAVGPDDEQESIKMLLAEISSNLKDPENFQTSRNEADILKSLALVEAAYLSSRTLMPEEPTKIFRMANIEP